MINSPKKKKTKRKAAAMTSRDFCYWLQGFFELSPNIGLDGEQVEMVRRHLALVFKHEIDPSAGDEKHQAELNKIHEKLNKVEKTAAEAHHHGPHFPPMIRC